MKRKMKQYEIYKITTDRLVDENDETLSINNLKLTYREALENDELVTVQNSQVTNKILDYLYTHKHESEKMMDYLVNVEVPVALKKKGENQYRELAKNGFNLNNKHFVRLYSGSGQIRRNTITFIREDLFEYVHSGLMCGLEYEDFGDGFNSAKVNAYCGLNCSGVNLLPFAPRVCVVDDYEVIKPNDTVNHVTEKEVRYITLPEEDFIIEDEQTEFTIDVEAKKAISNSNGEVFNIRKGVKKDITVIDYDKIEDSPELNSFDGQGLVSPAWMQMVADYIKYDYLPSSVIIRAPFIKGLLVTVDFHKWFAEQGITEITDLFGKTRNIADIDVLLTKSQFKMYKVYKQKCEQLGVNAWDYHVEQMQKNNLKWGIVKPNAKEDDYNKTLNYQYLQALQLDDEDIDKLCEPTKDFLERINSGDINEVYENLIISDRNSDNDDYKKLFQKVIEANPEMINDKHIRQLIMNECESKIKGAKLGKIIVRGNFQFCISDPLAQLQFIASNHCGKPMTIEGCIPKGNIYSNYWRNAEDSTDEIVLMRSPLIDRNEISKRNLIKEEQELFKYIKSGIILSIHDLTALQMGGCDFDGDILFSTNNPIIAKGSMNYGEAKPLYYKLDNTSLLGEIKLNNLIEADIRGLNSKVGQISNKSGTLYAMLERYKTDSREYEDIYSSIVFLGQLVGMEIDRIKTGVYPTTPMNWQVLQSEREQFEDEYKNITSESENQGIQRHNRLVPVSKPYYFRHLYTYVDSGVKELNRVYNKILGITEGISVEQMIELVESGEADFYIKECYDEYMSTFPVIDTNCVVNHISHYFENVEKEIKKTTVTEGEEMLKQFVSSEVKLNEVKLNEVKLLLNEYSRFRRFIAQQYDSKKLTISNKAKSEKRQNIMSLAKNHYKNLLLELCEGDFKEIFDYAVTASNSEVLVWDVLDDDIVDIIRRNENDNI